MMKIMLKIMMMTVMMTVMTRLEREVALRDSQIERLRQAVEDAGVQIHEGRKRLLQAEAENDRLRIRDVESQHKLAVLSRICGKSNEEIALLAEKTTRLPFSKCEDGKVGKYEERANLKNRRSSQELMLEVEHLEQQVVEQEQLHRKQLQEEKKSRKKASKEAEEDKVGLRARITSLQV